MSDGLIIVLPHYVALFRCYPCAEAPARQRTRARSLPRHRMRSRLAPTRYQFWSLALQAEIVDGYRPKMQARSTGTAGWRASNFLREVERLKHDTGSGGGLTGQLLGRCVVVFWRAC